jgi:ABC-type sulfate transport system permease subunit
MWCLTYVHVHSNASACGDYLHVQCVCTLMQVHVQSMQVHVQSMCTLMHVHVQSKSTLSPPMCTLMQVHVES